MKSESHKIKSNNFFRSGFVAVVGKPNVGKSSLMNAIVGTKVAITSPKHQTTRHRVLGVKNGDNYQIVFVDTPGVHTPSHQLGKFMEKTYTSEVKEADLVLLLVESTHLPTEEDLKAAQLIFKKEKITVPVFLVITKMDISNKDKIDQIREKTESMGNFTRKFEISALSGSGLKELEKSIVEFLQEGPAFFPPGMNTDQAPDLVAAEIVREKVLMTTRQEIPHSVFVHTEEMRTGAKPEDLYFSMMIFVEKESQKGIIIGKGGEKLKKIGSLAREELEFILGKHVYLDIRVKVKEDWKDRKDWLRSWGYEI
jgi:GTP-binding protein Era